MTTRSLLLVLSGPMQSWGTNNPIATRDTEASPTLSGVLGLIANTMGRDRTDPIEDLTALTMWVRIDAPGTLLSDFHTAGGGTWTENAPYAAARIDSQGKHTLSKNPVVSRRHYLAGATFLVILHGPDDTIHAASAALASPARPVFLGRKSCIPDRPVLLGLSDLDPDSLLTTTPWQISTWAQRQHLSASNNTQEPSVLDTILPSDANNWLAESRYDLPVSWAPLDRRYRSRYIVRSNTPLTDDLLHPAVVTARARMNNLAEALDGRTVPDIATG